MPFSQTHLSAAHQLLQLESIQRGVPYLSTPAGRSAFLLGSIGPDARVMSGVSREATHYYDIPRTDSRPIQDVVLDTCPRLKDVLNLTPDHSAFIAGYLTHLVMDVAWLDIVVTPFLYIEGEAWDTKHPNWRLYIILLSYLEFQANKTLPDGLDRDILQPTPDDWIDCLPDQAIVSWRNHVARLIPDGGPEYILELLSNISGIPYSELEDIVKSEEMMGTIAFSTVSRDTLERFQTETAQLSEQAVLDYLS